MNEKYEIHPSVDIKYKFNNCFNMKKYSEIATPDKTTPLSVGLMHKERSSV